MDKIEYEEQLITTSDINICVACSSFDSGRSSCEVNKCNCPFIYDVNNVDVGIELFANSGIYKCN